VSQKKTRGDTELVFIIGRRDVFFQPPSELFRDSLLCHRARDRLQQLDLFGWNSIVLLSLVLRNQNNKHLDVLTFDLCERPSSEESWYSVFFLTRLTSVRKVNKDEGSS